MQVDRPCNQGVDDGAGSHRAVEKVLSRFQGFPVPGEDEVDHREAFVCDDSAVMKDFHNAPSAQTRGDLEGLRGGGIMIGVHFPLQVEIAKQPHDNQQQEASSQNATNSHGLRLSR
jgi:hypothetical protein